MAGSHETPGGSTHGAAGPGRAIREVPASERPRERLALRGVGGLTAAELIGLIWGSGTRGRSAADLAADALARHDGLTGLARATELELAEVPGIGAAKAAQLVAAFELGRRLLADWPSARWTIRGPHDVADRLILQMGRLEREELRVVMLDTKNHVLRVATVYQGNVSLVPGAGRRALPRRGPAQCGRRDPRPQSPVRRPDAVAGRPASHRRGARGRTPARHPAPRPPRHRPRRVHLPARPGRGIRPAREPGARGVGLTAVRRRRTDRRRPLRAPGPPRRPRCLPGRHGATGYTAPAARPTQPAPARPLDTGGVRARDTPARDQARRTPCSDARPDPRPLLSRHRDRPRDCQHPRPRPRSRDRDQRTVRRGDRRQDEARPGGRGGGEADGRPDAGQHHRGQAAARRRHQRLRRDRADDQVLRRQGPRPGRHDRAAADADGHPVRGDRGREAGRP